MGQRDRSDPAHRSADRRNPQYGRRDFAPSDLSEDALCPPRRAEGTRDSEYSRRARMVAPRAGTAGENRGGAAHRATHEIRHRNDAHDRVLPWYRELFEAFV